MGGGETIGAFDANSDGVAAVSAFASGNGPGSNGVHATASSSADSAVYGEHSGSGIGIAGRGGPNGGEGVFGETASGSSAVYGKNDGSGPGVTGESAAGYGVTGTGGDIGVYAHNSRAAHDVYLATRGLAGDFYGDVYVHGNVTVTGDVILTNADCAEDFDVADPDSVEAGTVMVVDQEGDLRQSSCAYDTRVAGIVAGAGLCKPGIILGRTNATSVTPGRRLPITLVGKTWCKVDAGYAPVRVGDLLTTSPTPGHAMRAGDALRAFGAVVGKALRPLEAGQGLIPVLVALQ